MKNCSPGTWIFIEFKPKNIRTLVSKYCVVRCLWHRQIEENKLKLILEISVNNFFFLKAVWETWSERSIGTWICTSNKSLLKSSLLSNDIVLSLYSDRGLSNNTETKSESTSDVLSDWSSARHCPGPVSQQIIWGQNVLATSATLYRLSPPVSSLRIGTSDIISLKYWIPINCRGLYKTVGPRRSTGHISVLNKRHRCQNCAAVGGRYVVPRRALVVQTAVGDNFVWKSHRVADAR